MATRIRRVAEDHEGRAMTLTAAVLWALRFVFTHLKGEDHE